MRSFAGSSAFAPGSPYCKHSSRLAPRTTTPNASGASARDLLLGPRHQRQPALVLLRPSARPRRPPGRPAPFRPPTGSGGRSRSRSRTGPAARQARPRSGRPTGTDGPRPPIDLRSEGRSRTAGSCAAVGRSASPVSSSQKPDLVRDFERLVQRRHAQVEVDEQRLSAGAGEAQGQLAGQERPPLVGEGAGHQDDLAARLCRTAASGWPASSRSLLRPGPGPAVGCAAAVRTAGIAPRIGPRVAFCTSATRHRPPHARLVRHHAQADQREADQSRGDRAEELLLRSPASSARPPPGPACTRAGRGQLQSQQVRLLHHPADDLRLALAYRPCRSPSAPRLPAGSWPAWPRTPSSRPASSPE